MKKTKEFLAKASTLVAGDREKDYGDKVHNHKILPGYGQHIWIQKLKHMTWLF